MEDQLIGAVAELFQLILGQAAVQKDGVPMGLVHVEPGQDVLRVFRPQGNGQLRLAFHREQGAAVVALVLRAGLAEGGEQLAVQQVAVPLPLLLPIVGHAGVGAEECI